MAECVKARGFYDPVQRAVITNECTWCRSILSARLDAQHHACSSFLHGFCRAGGSHVQTEIKQPLLPVICPLCKIEEVANQESESSSLPHAEFVSLQFSSVSDYYVHIIRCHLSLPGIPRARFAGVAQFCCANNAPTARPFAVGNVRIVEKQFLDEDQKEEKRKCGTSAARRVSSKARSGQMPGSASGDPMMVMTLQVPQMERLAPREHGGINQ